MNIEYAPYRANVSSNTTPERPDPATKCIASLARLALAAAWDGGAELPS